MAEFKHILCLIGDLFILGTTLIEKSLPHVTISENNTKFSGHENVN